MPHPRKKIVSDGKVYEGQEMVMDGIRSFYEKLYANTMKNDEQRDDEDLYSECPNLSTKQKEDLDREIDLAELRKALTMCKDSAPGSDGITRDTGT
jgi:hypothetical protein